VRIGGEGVFDRFIPIRAGTRQITRVGGFNRLFPSRIASLAKHLPLLPFGVFAHN
jgi:hypothetical protein